MRLHIAARARPGPHGWISAVSEGDFSAIPSDLGWEQSAELALLIDGYELLGTGRTQDADAWLQARTREAEMAGRWSGDPIALWTTLFVEHRRWRFASPFEPDERHMALLDRLVRQLREALN